MPRVNKVIIIGDAGETGARALAQVIESQGLVPRICRTIYAAVAELVQAQVVLMVGTPHVLARENAALFLLAEDIGVTCCCLVGSSVSLSDALISRVGQGNVALCHTRNFRIWLEQYLALSRARASCRWRDGEDLTSEPLVSNAEQAALLGSVGKPDLASSGPFSTWPHPAVSTMKQTSPAPPSLPGEKTVRSRADDGVSRQSLGGYGDA